MHTANGLELMGSFRHAALLFVHTLAAMSIIVTKTNFYAYFEYKKTVLSVTNDVSSSPILFDGVTLNFELVYYSLMAFAVTSSWTWKSERPYYSPNIFPSWQLMLDLLSWHCYKIDLPRCLIF